MDPRNIAHEVCCYRQANVENAASPPQGRSGLAGGGGHGAAHRARVCAAAHTHRDVAEANCRGILCKSSLRCFSTGTLHATATSAHRVLAAWQSAESVALLTARGLALLHLPKNPSSVPKHNSPPAALLVEHLGCAGLGPSPIAAATLAADSAGFPLTTQACPKPLKGV